MCDVVTANTAALKTSGGSISMKRLVGKQCVLDTQPADTGGEEASHQSKAADTHIRSASRLV